MTRGTWQGSGTWQTSSLSLGDLVKPAALLAVALAVMALVAQVIVWLAVILGAFLAAGTAAVVVVWRLTRRREARHAAERPFLVARPAPDALTTTAIPQVTAPAVQVVEHHHYVHQVITAPDPAFAVVRAAITGSAAEGGEQHGQGRREQQRPGTERQRTRRAGRRADCRTVFRQQGQPE